MQCVSKETATHKGAICVDTVLLTSVFPLRTLINVYVVERIVLCDECVMRSAEKLHTIKYKLHLSTNAEKMQAKCRNYIQ